MLYIKVPYSEKELAKKKGAKWDAKKKSWYIPDGISIIDFSNWIPSGKLEQLLRYKHLISPVFIVMSSSVCWRCGKSSRVMCIASNGFWDRESYDLDYEDKSFSLLTYSNVSFISDGILSVVLNGFNLYKPSHSKTSNSTYYMNHCEHCGAKMGDYFMHHEPGGAFSPIDKEGAELITLIELPNDREYYISGDYGFNHPCYISAYSSVVKYN
ncbi:hypothetical protein GBN23_02910 [Plesiomonas shigelloides]|uniref:DUF5710 domain-containing protein n=1 Tax=Plesiomonas shigelloides TaxID=703 RepID=UPI0012622433|nr:DUF5710 domain-containing protein [Plesiomonas shigelloides]KAB7684440.1 hypothetical protein GBN23_02910 [Plesiomonas shigelloides]